MRMNATSEARRDGGHCALCATRSTCMTARFSREELVALQPVIVQNKVQRGDMLIEEGEVSNLVRTVKVGRVFGYRRGLDGRSRPVGMAGRGASFGVFGVFGQVTPASVLAASTSRVCDIPADWLRELVERSPELSRYLAHVAVEGCARLAAWSEVMRLRGVCNQLAYSLLLLADNERLSVIDLPSHIALAELLGTSRETVARSLSLLEEEGGIRRLEKKKCEVYRKALLGRLERRPLP